jgi:hypothetical protein
VQAAPLAGEFELGGELRTAIDVHRADGKGRTELQGIEELGGGLGGGASVRLNRIPARITSRAVNCLKTTPGTGRTDLDPITGPGDAVLLGFAHGVGARAQSAPQSRNAGAERFD